MSLKLRIILILKGLLLTMPFTLKSETEEDQKQNYDKLLIIHDHLRELNCNPRYFGGVRVAHI